MLFWLALISLIFVTAAMADLVRGNRSIRLLREVRVALPARCARVSVVVAARDEERHLGAALDSLLAQDYPDYEVIVVDDRSSDATPAILAQEKVCNARLRIVRVEALPAGWLGKNHALHRGAHEAAGTILIFADADVVLRPDTVTRAVAYALVARRDHIAIAPQVVAPGLLLGMFIGTFTLLFSLYARPWKAADPRSRCFIGIGAFNLVRAEVYRAVGGHARMTAAARWYAIGLPLMVAIFIWILWRSTFMTLRDGGITWRGTHYALAELKANRV